MKKILIVGNRRHQFIINYVKWFRKLCEKECKIDVFSYETFYECYDTDYLYDTVYTLRIPLLIQRNRILSIICRHIILIWNFRVLPKYDVVHIHYIEDYISRFSKLFSFLVKHKLIISIWGSDYLKASERKLNRMSILFNKADIISIVSDDVIKSFNGRYNFISNLSKKIIKLGFGLEPLSALRNIHCKNRESDKIHITIGYNARRNQQHLKIFNNIEKDKRLLMIRDKIKFIIPLTYPKDEEYIRYITTHTTSSKYSYTLLTNYMNDDEVAHLRSITDIFIQLQETDMLSGSMLEHMAAGNIVLTGSWLPYSDLDKLGLIYWKIDDLDQVSTILYELIKNITIYRNLVTSNKDIIFSNYLWENVIKSWISLTIN